MMISSIDLFFNRDCAGGRGPTVEPPRLVAFFEVSSEPDVVTFTVGGWGVVVAVGCLLVSLNILNEAGAADVEAEVFGVEAEVSCLLKRLKEGAAGVIFESVVADVVVAADCLLNRLKDGATVAAVGAGVVEVEVAAGCLLNILKDGATVAGVGAAVVFEFPLVEISFGAAGKNEVCVAGVLVEF